MRRERECGGRESAEGERVWREREYGEESGGRERTDRKKGVDERREKKTEWRMKVDDLF